MISAAPALLALLLAAGPASAAVAPTLRRPLSTRALGLAEAHTAVPDGLQSLGTNPAGLSISRRPELFSAFSSGILDDSFGFLGWAQPFARGTLGVGASYYNAGKVDLRFASGATETRTAQLDYVGHLAWAMPLGGGLSVGATAKYYRFELAQEARTSGWAADAGAQWKTPVKGLVLGAAIQNAGPAVKFEQDADPLPTTVRGGVSWTIAGPEAKQDAAETYLMASRFLLTADAVKTRDEQAYGAAGAEAAMDFGPERTVALRAGWKINSPADALAMGVGLREGRYTLDYAFSDKRSLGFAHHAGFGVRF